MNLHIYSVVYEHIATYIYFNYISAVNSVDPLLFEMFRLAFPYTFHSGTAASVPKPPHKVTRFFTYLTVDLAIAKLMGIVVFPFQSPSKYKVTMYTTMCLTFLNIFWSAAS